MKNLILKPGAIVLWKDHNIFKRIMAKLKRKELEYNCYCIIPYRMDLVSFYSSMDTFKVLEPRKPYSNVEKELLGELLESNVQYKSEIEAISVVNIIRPDTLNLSSFTLDSLFNNKYYREVHAEEC